ncbi:MAG: MFS transporter [Actinobacteria bacterium]|nr:MFS transporter [Actinomycetota bacterium]
MTPPGAGRDETAPYRPGRPIGQHAGASPQPSPPQPPPPRAASERGGRGAGRYAEPRIHPRDLGRRGVITPFARLARGQAFSVMGEALFAIGLANTVFFSTDPQQSKWRVAGYLVLTFAPFLVAGPFIGPVLDRAAGGRKWVIFGAAVARAMLSLLLLRNLNDIYFYPEAFLMLVFSKVNLISKSALVPTTVNNDEELVEANSKLTSLGALSAVAGGALAGLAVLIVKIPFLKLDDGNAKTVAILFLASICFLLTASQAWSLPRTQVAEEEVTTAERAELHGAGIFLAATATGLSRGIMGFLTFLLAFWVKQEGRPIIWIGVLVGAAQLGYFLGSLVAPPLRRKVPEERMIQIALGATAIAAVVTLFLRDAGSGLGGAAILAFTVGLTSNVQKQGFDSLVQRDAPDANRGRAFAKFETRFQLWWAIGALVPVVLDIPLWAGIVIIASVSAFALVSYLLGLYEMTEVVAGRRQPKPKKPKPWSVEAIRARRKPSVGGGDGDEAGAELSNPMGDLSGLAGSPPGVPIGPAAIGPTDPTVADGADGLLGQPDVPLPNTLSDAPEGGLFDPGAPPPPKGPGYHRAAPSPPSWANDSTGTAEWASVPAAPAEDPATSDPATSDPLKGTVVEVPLPFEESPDRTTSELPIVRPSPEP